MNEPKLPPYPSGSRFAHTWRFAKRPLSSLDEYFKELGEAFTVKILGMGTFVVLSNPEAIEALFMGDPETIVTGESNAKMFEAFLGKYSLLNMDGPRHRRKRKLLMPPFHGKRMHVYGRIIRETTRAEMSAWKPGEQFPILHVMQNITLEVVMRAIFGIDDPAQRDRVRAKLLHFLEGSYRPEAAVMGIPSMQIDLGRYSPWGRILRTRAPVYEEILGAVADRRKNGTAGRDDILSLLVDARDEDGQPMTDEELRDDLFTLLIVGHETTAATLAWAFWAVLSRPEIVEKIRSEARQLMPDGLVPEKLHELVYLDATVKEVTRLHPVTDGAARLLKAPTRLGPYYLPAGVMAAASTWLTHRNPAHWIEPDRFMPERFVNTKISPFTFLPFGGGPRTCVGAAFATYEMKVVMHEILTGSNLQLAPGYEPEVIRRAITLSPSGGVPVVLPVAPPEAATQSETPA